jgi:hypothetical protein
MDEGREDWGGLIPGWDGLTMRREVFQMQFDCLASVGNSFFDGRPVGHASGQRRDKHRITTFGVRNQIDLV